MAERHRPVNAIALELALIKAMKTRIGMVESRVKDELQEHVRRGTIYASLEGDIEVATVVVKGESEPPLEVEDPKAFLEWVKATRPTAVVESVRSSDYDDIVARAKKTGELPPGMTVGTPRAGGVSVGQQSKAQEEALLGAYRDGRLAVDLGHAPAVMAAQEPS